MRIHDEIRIEDDHLIAGIDGATKSEDKAAAGAAGDENFAVVLGIKGANVSVNLGAQFWNALGDGIGVGAAVDGGVGGGLDRLRHVEIRLTDAEVDGVFETARQFKDFADA